MPLTRGTVEQSTGLLTWVKSFREFSGFVFEDIKRSNGTLCSATTEAEASQ